MRSRRLTLAALLGLLVAVSAPAVAGAAAIDPERNLAQPVPSRWETDLSEAEIKALAGQGWRLTDLGIESQTRFTGAFVRDSGPFARSWYWWFGKSGADVNALTRDAGRRLIDVEPYTVDGQRRFATVSVLNQGEAAKEWGWNFDLTVAQVTAEAMQYGLRVVDLDSYTVDGRRLYSYVGIKNLGVDARDWWLFEDVGWDTALRIAAENGARLVDVEWLSRGLGITRVSVAMVKNPEGTFTLPVAGVSTTRLEELLSSNGARVAEVEHRGDGWSGVLIDNIAGENARLREVVRSTAVGSSYFGVFAKRVGGSTHVGLAHQDGFQPMSVGKLLPAFYAMELVDKGTAKLTDTIRWTTPIGKPDEVWCTGTSASVHVSSLEETLKLSLVASVNPVHEGLLATFGQQAIVNRLHALGMTGTQLYPVCKRAGRPDWTSNRTTLAEMGSMFELIDKKKVFPNNWYAARNKLYEIMFTWSGELFRRVVAEEAAKLGKSAYVNRFVELIQLDGKGGSHNVYLGNGPKTIGRALSYRVTFPIKVPVSVDPSGIGPDAHVGGYFVHRLYMPCFEQTETRTGGPSQVCDERERAVEDGLWKVTTESQRTAIREALETW